MSLLICTSKKIMLVSLPQGEDGRFYLLKPLPASSIFIAANLLPFYRQKTDCQVFFFVFFFNKFIYLFIYFWLRWVFVAVRGLSLIVLSSCGEWGLLFVAVHRLLIVVASFVVEHGL